MLSNKPVVKKMLGFVTSWCLLALVSGYGSGPPVSRCQDLFPQGHQVDAQMTPPPFTISVSNTVFSAGDSIQITVSSSSGSSFKGLFLQARRLLNCSNVAPVGTFTLQQGESELQLLNCSGAQDSVGHNSSVTKTLKSFTWTAPSQSPGHLYFRATFVQSAYVFWTTTISSYMTDTSDASDLPSETCDARTTFTENGGHAVISNVALTVLMSVLSARSYILS